VRFDETSRSPAPWLAPQDPHPAAASHGAHHDPSTRFLAALALAASGTAAQDLDFGASEATLSTQSMMGGAWDGFYAGGSVGGAFGDTDGFFALDSNLDGSSVTPRQCLPTKRATSRAVAPSGARRL
jgi:hypothetical protein